MFGKNVFIMGNGVVTENEYKKGTVIGNAEIFGGEFGKLRVVGNTTISGNLAVGKMTLIGMVNASDTVKTDLMKLTGHCTFNRLEARHIVIRWGDKNTEVFKIEGNIKTEVMEVLAKCHVGEAFNARSYIISGIFQSEVEIQCDNFICPGIAVVPSINAEHTHIYPRSGTHIGEIFSTDVKVQRNFKDCPKPKLPLFYSMRRHLMKAKPEESIISINSIEADSIYIENAKVGTISGKKVIIGQNCEVGQIEYMETLHVSPGSHVGKADRI
jgi:hypothetical protein